MNNFVLAVSVSVLFACSALASEAPPLPKEEITIAAVGDVMLGGRTGPFLVEHGPDYPYREVMSVLREADIVAANLESAISSRGAAVKDKQFTLRADPLAARSLKTAGIRVVTLANNHSMDFGPQALQDTLEALTENEILFTGAGMNLDDARSPALVKIKGKTLAFLSYSLTYPVEFYASGGRAGTAPGYAEFVKADILKVRPKADLVIVSIHWGAELMTAAKDYQIALGRQAIDWGADLVLGHHPHVLQEIEVYKNRLIAYSLGNFVFGSESNRTNYSMILLLTFQGNTLVRIKAIPLDVNNYRVHYQPRVLSGASAAEVLGSVNSSSARFNTKLDLSGNTGTILLAPIADAAHTQDVTGAEPASQPAFTAPAPGSSPQTSPSTSFR